MSLCLCVVIVFNVCLCAESRRLCVIILLILKVYMFVCSYCILGALWCICVRSQESRV